MPGVGAPASGHAAHAHAIRREDVRADRVPGLALDAVPVLADRGRRRRGAGQAVPRLARRPGRRAVADAYDEQAQATSYRPDVALINFYDEHAKMGMHADKDERSPAPVVSLSLGSACVFRFGNAESRGRPWHDVTLESGDLFVFGGEARLAFHGVMKTVPATERPDIGLPAGRLNITLRESGLA